MAVMGLSWKVGAWQFRSVRVGIGSVVFGSARNGSHVLAVFGSEGSVRERRGSIG